MLPNLPLKEMRNLSLSDRDRYRVEVLQLPFGDPSRREWLVALATAYSSWDRMANDTNNTPTLHVAGDQVSEALAVEYDAYHQSIGSGRKAY